jgi:hypothetical protein
MTDEMVQLMHKEWLRTELQDSGLRHLILNVMARRPISLAGTKKLSK